MAKNNWRDYQNAMLKKVLEKSSGGEVSSEQVQNYLESNASGTGFYDRNPDVARPASYYEKHPEEWIAFLNGKQSAPAAPTADAVSELAKFASSSSEALPDNLSRGEQQAFWQTKEFKDFVKQEIAMRTESDRAQFQGTVGQAYTPPNPDVLASKITQGAVNRYVAGQMQTARTNYENLVRTAEATSTTRQHVTNYESEALREEASALLSSAGSAPPQVKARLESQAAQLLQKAKELDVKPTSAVFIGGEGDKFYPEATPFYVDEQEQVNLAMETYRKEPTVQNFIGAKLTVFGKWMNGLFYTGVGDAALTWGGTSEKEGMYAEYSNNPAWDIMSGVFNSAALLKDAIEGIFVYIDPYNKLSGQAALDEAARLRASVNNPNNPASEQSKALALAKAAELERQGQSSVSPWQAKLADIQNSMDIVNREFASAWSKTKELAENSRWYSGPEANPEKYLADLEARRKEFTERSLQLQNMAYTQYDTAMKAPDESTRDLSFQRAIDLQMQSIETRRKGEDYDHFGAATWIREPDRYDAFIKAAATIELQTGRELTPIEVRRLKDMYTNTWTELSFELVFDATNIPIIGPLADAAKSSKTFTKYILEPSIRLSADIKKAADNTPVLGFLTRRMVDSVANGHIAPLMADSLFKMKTAYAASDDFLADIPKLQSFIDYVKLADPADAEQLFKAAKEGDNALQALKNISFADFKKMTDLDIDGLTLKALSPGAMDVLTKIKSAYPDVNKFMKDLGKIRDLAAQVKRVPIEAAEKIFKESKLKALKGMSLEEFLTLADELKESKSWGQIYQESVEAVQAQRLRELRASAGLKSGEPSPKSMIQDAKKYGIENSRLAIMDFAGKFGDSYKEMHRIYNGSTLLDDTIAGQIVRLSRLFGDALKLAEDGTIDSKILNPKMLENLKLSADFDAALTKNGLRNAANGAIDRLIVNMGVLAPKGFRKFIKGGGKFIETASGYLLLGRQVWSTVVLTTPRWLINNYLDSSARNLVYGGNVFDDFMTLMHSTQLEFIDAAGIAPMAFHQQLGKAGISLSNTAIYKTVYGGEKPKWGLFSYWMHEWNRLKQAPAMELTDIQKFAPYIGKKLQDNIQGLGKSKFPYMWDGLRTVMATTAAVSDYNAAIEFTLRIRSFHREYFRLLSELEPEFMSRGMEALNANTRALAEHIWKEAKSNPAKITAMIDALAGKKGKAPASWAFTLPADWDDTLKASGMDLDAIPAFTSLVREQVDTFLTDSVRATGKLPDKVAIDKFIDDAIDSYQNQTQAALSQLHDIKDMDMAINPAKDVVEGGDVSKSLGSAPNFNRASAINESIERLQKEKTLFKKGADVIEDYTTAISRYGKVNRVDGNSVRVLRTADGISIEIGKDISKAADAYASIHDATIKVISNQPPEILRTLGMKDADQFESLIKQFTVDPAKLVNENPKAFKAIMDELDSNPSLLRILKKTGNVASYEGAAEVFRRVGQDAFSVDILNDPRRVEQVYQSLADNIQPVSAERRVAALNHGDALVSLEKTVRALPEFAEFSDKYNELLFRMSRLHEDYNDFLRFASPGPKTEPLGALRQSKWDEVEHLQALAYEAESKLAAELNEAFAGGAKLGAARVEELLKNFNEEYLNRMNIKLTWAEGGETVTHAAVTRINKYGDRITQTWPRGSGVVEWIQSRFFSPQGLENTNPRHLLHGTKFDSDVRREINLAIHDAFNVTAEQANTFRKILELHGKAYTEATGKPVSDYLAKWGFQEINGTFQLPKDAVMLNSGIIQRAKDGTYTLFGGPHSDFASLMRSSSIVFLEDLKKMAIYSPDYKKDLDGLYKAIEEITGTKVKNGKLSIKQADAYATSFMKYFTGEGAQLKPGFEKMSKWMANTFVGLQGSSVLDDLPEDAVNAMNRMFIREQMKPTSSGAVAESIAKELSPTSTKEEILTLVNNPPIEENDYQIISKKAISIGTPEQKAELEALIAKIGSTEGIEKSLLELNLIEQIDSIEGNLPTFGRVPVWTDDLFTGDTFKRNNHVLNVSKKILLDAGATADELAGMTQLEVFNAAIQNSALPARIRNYLSKRAEKAKVFTKVGEIPVSVLEEVIGKSQTSQELQEAWNVWKTRRDYTAFSKIEVGDIKVLDNPDTFKAYLKYRLDNIPLGDLSDEYERILYDLEGFQDSFIKHNRMYAEGVEGVTPVNWDTAFNTPIRKFQMHDGIKVWMQQNATLRNNLEAGMQSMETLRKFLSEGKYKNPVVSADTLEELKKWGATATSAKADLVSTILSGGKVNDINYKGAVDLVNERMLDYSKNYGIDGIMKNLFPFWMFPSRSLPFWTKTLATHPELISFYNKIQRFSAGSRYQAGAINSQGQPLTSMDGYVPIPGTDLWFNPLAPFSFRYVMDITQSQNEMIYRQQDATSQDIPIDAYLAREFLESGPMFGFNVAPWMSWIMKGAFNISDATLPPFPVAPEIPLMPRWLALDMVEKAKRMNINLSGVVDAVYPESSWHDNLVERQILLNARTEIEGLGDQDPSNKRSKELILEEARRAIADKGDNPLWLSTYKEVTTSEAGRAWSSFFTGIYPKEFSDAQADLYALRNDLNLQKSAMNSLFQTSVFQLPDDAHERWDAYLNQLNTTDGWIYRLYTDINYVRNENGQLIKDKEERNKYLALAIQEEINQQSYYEGRKVASNALNAALKDIPVGAPFEVVSKAYDAYFERVELLKKNYPFEYSRSYGTNKPVELIQEDLTNTYFKLLNSTRPVYNPEEDYDVYRQRVVEWEARLPLIAPLLIRRLKMTSTEITENLHKDQQLDKDFYDKLLEQSNAAGLDMWNRNNDTVFDALNTAWRKTYWDEYWNTVGPLRGAERDLAEHDFGVNHPPPTNEEMVAFIMQYYGGRFTEKEIMEWLQGGREVYDIDERITKERGEEYAIRQEIYDLLSWRSPSSKLNPFIDDKMSDQGAVDDFTNTWLKLEGQVYVGDIDKLKETLNQLKTTYAELGITKPDREQLVEYVKAQEANTQFKEIVEKRFGSYDAILEIQKEYYDEDAKPGNQYKKDWINEHPKEWVALQTYWDMRRSYGNAVPIWGKYYLWEPGTPEQFQGATGEEPVTPEPTQQSSVPSYTTNAGVPKPAQGGASGGGGETTPAPTTPSAPTSSITFPPGMKEAIGTTLTRDLEALYTKNKYLSAEAKQFLKGVRSRHPEWAAFINDALSK